LAWLKPKAKGSFGYTKTPSLVIRHNTVPECINVQVQLLRKGNRKMEHSLYQVAIDAPFYGHKYSHSLKVTSGSLSSRLVVQKEKNFLKYPKGAALHDTNHTRIH